MTNVKYINDERLCRWKTKLNRQHATPVLLIGFGMDHKAGEVTILVTEERTNEEIKNILLYALKQLSLPKN
ncbi:MAG TPA: hypothetical protein PL045_11840 [Chitinophagaceae bacterium]|nr:hypothetical protein [Chitinophagaceae bacterium]